MVRSLLFSLCLICTLFAIFARGQPINDDSNDDNDSRSSSSSSISDQATVAVDSSDLDSLPPDTFRKLAQALYQRGDKAENRLQRKFFYNDNVTCNDGSVAGFYIRRNYQSKRWIIFLEGTQEL